MEKMEKMEIYKKFVEVFHNLKNEMRSDSFDTMTIYEKQKFYETCLLFDLLVNSGKSNQRDIRSHRQKNFDTTITLQSQVLHNCIIVSNERDRDTVLNKGKAALFADKLFFFKTIQKDVMYKIPLVFDLSNNIFLPHFIDFKSSIKNSVMFSDKNSNEYATRRVFESDSQIKIHKMCKKYGCPEEMLYEISKSSLNNFFKDFAIFKSHNDDTIEEAAGGDVDTIKCTTKWNEIFEMTGLVPRDCRCMAYSSALYERCVVQGKSVHGLRPKHSNNCDKKCLIKLNFIKMIDIKFSNAKSEHK